MIKYAVIFCNLCQSEWNYDSQNRLTCYFQHDYKFSCIGSCIYESEIYNYI